MSNQFISDTLKQDKLLKTVRKSATTQYDADKKIKKPPAPNFGNILGYMTGAGLQIGMLSALGGLAIYLGIIGMITGALLLGLFVVPFSALTFIPAYVILYESLTITKDHSSGLYLKLNEKEHKLIKSKILSVILLSSTSVIASVLALSLLTTIIPYAALPFIAAGLLAVTALVCGAIINHFKQNKIDNYTCVFGQEKTSGNRVKVNIPQWVKHIGEDAFVNSTVEELVMYGEIKTIDKTALLGCEKLRSITIITDSDDDFDRLKRQIQEGYQGEIFRQEPIKESKKEPKLKTDTNCFSQFFSSKKPTASSINNTISRVFGR